jgi:hypothetical protein
MTTTTRTAMSDVHHLLMQLQSPNLKSAISAARHAEPNGTMRAWMQAHEGGYVDTLQVGYKQRAWNPGMRRVSVVRPSYVMLDESRRDYAGMVVVASSPNALIVHKRGDFDSAETMVYLSTAAQFEHGVWA